MQDLDYGRGAVAFRYTRVVAEERDAGRGSLAGSVEGLAVNEDGPDNVVPWMILLFAGGLEIVWAIGLKYTEGFTRLWPTVGTLAIAWLSFFLLAYAMKSIPVGTAYAIWTGIGAAGTAILGIMLFGEPASLARLACLGLIIVGIIGLKLLA